MHLNSNLRTVGFIGIGTMGNGMAMNILKKGYPLVIWNRSREKYQNHVEFGAQSADTPKELAEKSDVVICMLSTPSATLDVILGRGEWQNIGVLNGLHTGKIVVDMSTNLPSVAQDISEKLIVKGIEFVDAPVIGSVKPANEGKLTILAAGKKGVIENIKPILKTMGKSIWYIGKTGKGCSLKLTMNLHLFIVTGAFAESLVFGAKAGINPKLIVDLWNNTIFKTYITETKGQKVLTGDWTPSFTIELASKDINLATEVAEEVNAPIPLGSVFKQLLTATIANGKKDFDFCALVTLYEKLANIKVSKS